MAASLQITTTDRLKVWRGGDSFSADWTNFWTAAIAALSQLVEDRLGRILKAEARTTYANIEKHRSTVHLKGYPITAIGSIYEDPSRAFGTGTLVDSDSYTFGTGEEGIVWFDYELSAGPKALKVTYTGGMAADTAALATAFPDLVEAADKQLLHVFRNKDSIGFGSVAGGAIGGGGQLLIAGIADWSKAFGNLLPELKEAITRYRSITERW